MMTLAVEGILFIVIVECNDWTMRFVLLEGSNSQGKVTIHLGEWNRPCFDLFEDESAYEELLIKKIIFIWKNRYKALE